MADSMFRMAGRNEEGNAEPIATDNEGNVKVKLFGSNTPVTLLPVNKTTTGIGTVQPVQLNKSLRFEVWGTGTYTVQIQGIGNSGTARNLPVWDITNKTFVASNNITAAGFYEVDIQGFVSVQANVSAISGGNVNAAGTVIA